MGYTIQLPQGAGGGKLKDATSEMYQAAVYGAGFTLGAFALVKVLSLLGFDLPEAAEFEDEDDEDADG